MRQRLLLISNALMFILGTIFLMTLQTSVWFQFFGLFPAPMLWFLPIVYLCLYRSASEGIFLLYLVALSVSVLSSKPITLISSYSLILYFLVSAFKSRIYWEGYRYFALVASVSALLFQAVDVTFSFFVEDYVISLFGILERTVSCFLTAFFTLPVYMLFLSIDKVTDKDQFSAPGHQAI